MVLDGFNPFLEFYGKHGISPVHQDIDNFRLHMLRREKLYRILGLAPYAFSQKTIIEIGPGGGHNSLAFFNWGANVVFVEPNPTAQAELRLLLVQHGILNERWELFPVRIEEMAAKGRGYDIVIAEGFLSGINNASEVINKIAELVNPGGVAVVTCVDAISFFFEIVKRIIANRLIQQTDNFEEQVGILSRAFSSHLKNLEYASRPVEDWVIDLFLNPAGYGELFSIIDCIKVFGNDFELMGSSPSMFTNYSWYKNVDFDFSNSIVEQFNRKRHSLLLWDMEASERSAELNERLFRVCEAVRNLAGEFESQRSPSIIQDIIEQLNEVIIITNDLDNRIAVAINEAITLLKEDNLNAEKVANAAEFAAAFGRGQQYVSMVRKFTK